MQRREADLTLSSVVDPSVQLSTMHIAKLERGEESLKEKGVSNTKGKQATYMCIFGKFKTIQFDKKTPPVSNFNHLLLTM